MPHSHVFYNRVKGEMQQAIAGLGYQTLVIAQPSLLIGDRAALGQPVRNAEVLVARLLRPVMGFVPKGVRPIAAGDVAAAMLKAMRAGQPGTRILGSGLMQGATRRMTASAARAAARSDGAARFDRADPCPPDVRSECDVPVSSRVVCTSTITASSPSSRRAC